MQVLMDHIALLNWPAVLSAAAAGYVMGAVWYSNALFGKQWMKGAGLSARKVKESNSLKPLLAGAITVVISAVSLAVLFNVLALSGPVRGAIFGALVAGGFIATNKIMHSLFELKSDDYIKITVLGDIVSFALMGAVLGLF